MKRILFAVLFGVASLSSISTKAQVNLNINIGSQPQWGPTGYDHVDYYYLPDVDAYYYVPTSQYIYLVNGTWAWRSSLPSRYRGYDLYNGYKVVMNGQRPYLSHNTHIRQYSKYKNYGGKQGNIRNSKDVRYVNARNNRPATVRTTHTTHKTVVKVDNNNGRSAQGNNPKGDNKGHQNNNRAAAGNDSKHDSKGNGNQSGRH